MLHHIIRKALVAGALAASAMTAYAADYRITDFGCVDNDSTKIQTVNIQAAIDRAEADGGGTVVVPRGTFLTGALFFKPGTKLHLDEGAVLKGSDDIANYPLIPSRMEGRSIYYYAAVVNAYFVDNFEITGPGTINGNGYRFWVDFWERRQAASGESREFTNLEVHRPRLVFIWGCDHVKLQGVKLLNSAFWTTHFYQCTDVTLENCHIQAPNKPVKAPSSDAIDLDVCRDVVVRGCYIDVNDDGVCVKGGKGVYANRSLENGSVENVLVENCSFGPACHGILTMGSECIHAKNITLRDCTSQTRCSVLRLKMRPDTYQLYEDITVSGVTGTVGTVIEMQPWTQFYTLEGSSEQPFGTVRNILIENIDASCRSLGVISGNPGDKVDNVTLKNINLKAQNPAFTCVYPSVKFENVVINGQKTSNPSL